MVKKIVAIMVHIVILILSFTLLMPIIKGQHPYYVEHAIAVIKIAGHIFYPYLVTMVFSLILIIVDIANGVVCIVRFINCLLQEDFHSDELKKVVYWISLFISACISFYIIFMYYFVYIT